MAPARKAAARDLLRAHLLVRPPGRRPAQFHVRINPLDDAALIDLAAVMPSRPDGIMLPKTFGVACAERQTLYLHAFEAAHGIASGSTRIIAVATETARGALTLAEFADRPVPRLTAMTWGAEDLAAVLGASSNRGSDGQWTLTYRLAQANLLLAARAAGVAASDTLFVDFRDNDVLRASSRAAAGEGFEGRIAIHPAQVAPINDGFSPMTAEVTHAERVLAAFAAAAGVGTVGLDGKTLDISHLKRAQAVLIRHKAATARH